jgi:hypothetical protein
LPVDGGLLERQVVARHARRLVDAQVDPTLHVAHQSRVAVGVEEIRKRDDRARLIEHPVERLVHGCRHGAAGPDVLLLVQGCERFPVVPERPVDAVPRGITHQAIGAAQRDVAQVGELPAGAVLRHLLVSLLGLEGERRGPGQPVAHLPHQFVGTGLDETRAGGELRLDRGRRRLGGGGRRRVSAAAR